jgi:hypothetical protein
VTRDDIAEAIEGFEFNGKYTGGRHKARKENVDFSGLSETHRYLVELWLEVHKGSSNHAKVVKTALERLNHVDKCIEEKGYVDYTKDVKGRTPDWRKWIDFLVEKEYLKSEKQKGSGKKTKIVYLRTKNASNPHHD